MSPAYTLGHTSWFVKMNTPSHTYKKFCADTANYGGQHISEFHSDNGGEYMSKVYIKLIEESWKKAVQEKAQ